MRFYARRLIAGAQIFPEICDDLRSAPQVAAVADLHVENFETWRDADVQLVWGVYDFDEVSVGVHQ